VAGRHSNPSAGDEKGAEEKAAHDLEDEDEEKRIYGRASA